MENTNILKLKYPIYKKIQNILDSPGTMESFLEVLPPDCSCEDIRISMELQSMKYNMTPAKVLLQFLGNKGYGVLNLIDWFQTIGLEKALMLLKSDEPLRIIVHPEKEITVFEGGEITLTCVAASYPPPEFQWFKDDEELLLHVESELTITSASLTDSGKYTCLVTKLNRKTKAIEYQYSDYCTVEVIPSELHVKPSVNQEPQSSAPNFRLPDEKHFSLDIFNQGEIMSTMPKENSVISPVIDNNGPDLPSPMRGENMSPVPEENSDIYSVIDNNDLDLSSPKREVITITKNPYVNGKVSQGMSLCLTCEAISISLPVNYLWIKNGRPLADETSPHLILRNLYPDPNTGETKWRYQCAVYNKHDQVYSETAVVELDEVNDTTPFMAQQKYAFMVANDTYDHLEPLKKPAADVKDLATIFSSLGFKTFASRNLTLTEMRNALYFFCKALLPGSYALFFFAGHGFDSCGQTYLLPVDSSDQLLQHESVCLEHILECMQEKNPAINILLVDACRKLSPSGNSHGKIFDARMKNNTIYGYSTSFLCASHESDEEDNSVYVKHLKKYISQNKCIQDILTTVHSEFAKDPVVRNLQYPGIKSTLAEKRKFNDPVQESVSTNALTDIVNWCDMKREKISKSVKIPIIKSKIEVEFDHHMGTFCSGTDACLFLHLDSDADLSVLREMEIDLTFQPPALCTTQMGGVALKNVKLIPGECNFILKKEVLNIQKINIPFLKGDILLMFNSQNFVKHLSFDVDFTKIVQLQLSVNNLQSNNIEECQNHTTVQNSLK